jgi:hypothetical protein
MRDGGYRSKAARNKAIITVAHAILVINWNILSTGKPYEDSARTTSAAGPAPSGRPAA